MRIASQQQSGLRELEVIRRETVDHELSTWFEPSEAALARQRSLYRYLFDELSKAARDYAASQEMAGDDFRYGPLEEAHAIMRDLQCSLDDPSPRLRTTQGSASRPDPMPRLNFWRHEYAPLVRLKEKKIPYIDRAEVERVTGVYLTLPFRCTAIDRVLADILVAMELWAFGNEMLNCPESWIFPVPSPLRQPHALLSYFTNFIGNGVFYLGGAALAIYGVDTGWLGQGWGAGIAVVLVGLFLLSLALSTLYLPFAWRNQAKARSKVINMIDAMAAMYLEMNSDGPISAKHIRERARNAADKGVIWPSPLFALLDDIERRSGRF